MIAWWWASRPGRTLALYLDSRGPLLARGMSFWAVFAVFAAVAGAIATQGLGIVITFGKFMGGFYLSLFLLWLLLLVVCWPLALVALLLYPLVWLVLLPFRLLRFAVEGVLGFVRALVMLPARVLGGRPA